jgi:hypothetical protein
MDHSDANLHLASSVSITFEEQKEEQRMIPFLIKEPTMSYYSQ